MAVHGSVTRSGSAESRAEPSRFARSHFNRIARARGEKEGANGKGENRTLFFGRARARRHYSHEDRKHRGARREGWDPWIIARSYFFFLYIVLYLGGVHTYKAQGWVLRARTDTALTWARKTQGSKRKQQIQSYMRVLLYIYTYTVNRSESVV